MRRRDKASNPSQQQRANRRLGDGKTGVWVPEKQPAQ